jgi:threonine dehydratase
MILPDLSALEWATGLVHSVLSPTPQIRWPLLCSRVGAEVWVKHENHNPTGAFKIRGGIVYLEALKQRERGVSGVIAATRDNHGQSIAFAAARLGVRAVIIVPYGNSPEKNAAMRAFGATLIEHGRDFQEALEYASDLSVSRPVMRPRTRDLLQRDDRFRPKSNPRLRTAWRAARLTPVL